MTLLRHCQRAPEDACTCSLSPACRTTSTCRIDKRDETQVCFVMEY